MNDNFELPVVVELIKHIVDEVDLRLYDLHFNEVTRVFRVFIDRENGTVSIDDCKKVSKLINRELDQSEMVTFAYRLEVSSPGVERHLTRPEHFVWAQGKMVEIDTGDRKIKGYLRRTKQDGLVVATDGGESVVLYSSVVRARVVEDLDYGKRR